MPESIRSLRRRSCRNFISPSLSLLSLSVPFSLSQSATYEVSLSCSSHNWLQQRAHSQASSDLLFSYCSRLTFCLPLYRCCPCRCSCCCCRCCCCYFSRRLASPCFVEQWVSIARLCKKLIEVRTNSMENCLLCCKMIESNLACHIDRRISDGDKGVIHKA